MTSTGQGPQDPRLSTEQYLEKHQLPELMEVSTGLSHQRKPCPCRQQQWDRRADTDNNFCLVHKVMGVVCKEAARLTVHA